MTKEAALNAFWYSFGIPAYEENTVPTDADGNSVAKLPYITYQAVFDGYGNTVFASASLWYRSPNWMQINAKTREINDIIGRGGVQIHVDNGTMWIQQAKPFAQNMSEPKDNMIRRKLLNISITYNTTD